MITVRPVTVIMTKTPRDCSYGWRQQDEMRVQILPRYQEVQVRGLIVRRRSGLLDRLSVVRPRDRAAQPSGQAQRTGPCEAYEDDTARLQAASGQSSQMAREAPSAGHGYVGGLGVLTKATLVNDFARGINPLERPWGTGSSGRVQGCSGPTPNPTANLRHQMTALLNAERSVPAGMA